MFSKIVAAVISPFGTALLLLLFAFAAAQLGAARAARRLLGVALAWLLLWSSPVASDALRGWLEDQAGPRAIEGVQAAEVAVVLGGAVGSAKPPRRLYPDLGSSSDRVWHAARLYHAGKVKRVLLSGGSHRPGEPAEAPAMERFLLDLGVPAAAIWKEDASINTATNAAESARVLRARGVQSIVLVTSALHMRRARANFEREGLVVHPAPTDFEVVDEPLDGERVLPSAGALADSGRAFKEVVGRWVGR